MKASVSSVLLIFHVLSGDPKPCWISVGSNEFSAPESIWLSEEHAIGSSLLCSSLGLLVSFNVLFKTNKQQQQQKSRFLKILSYIKLYILGYKKTGV